MSWLPDWSKLLAAFARQKSRSRTTRSVLPTIITLISIYPIPYTPPPKWSSLPKLRTSTSPRRSPLPPRTTLSWSPTMRTMTTVTPVSELLFLRPPDTQLASRLGSTILYSDTIHQCVSKCPDSPFQSTPGSIATSRHCTGESKSHLSSKIIRTTTDIISRWIQSRKFPTRMRRSSTRSPFTSVSPP